MEFLYCILLLYLAKISCEEHLSIPENFSKVLNKLIHRTKNLDNINVTSIEEKLDNASKIFYLKTKGEPSLVLQIKLENVTNEANDSKNEVKEIISIEERNFDDVSNFDQELKEDTSNPTDYFNDKKAVHIEYVPKSIEYIIQSDSISNEEDFNDIPYIENNTRRSGFVHDNTIYPKEIVNTYSNDSGINESEGSQGINVIQKSAANKDLNSTLKTLKLNEKIEKLFKEMREIKKLHKKGEDKKSDVMKVIPDTRRMSVAKPVALMPFNYMSRNLNVMPILYPPINRYRDQRQFILNSPPSIRKVHFFTNKIGVKTNLMNPKITRHYFTNYFT